MLRKLGGTSTAVKGKPIGKVGFPQPFEIGLEYNPPARGVWNIVHMGMLIPQSHQIYFCAQGCLRGVVQTTAEMNAMDRLSWAYLCDEDYADGSMEQNIIDSMSEVIRLMPEKPPCVLMFLSCMHLFAGVDFDMIIDELSASFPDIDFVDCYMTPTMRFSGLAPVPTMCRQMFRPLKKTEKDKKAVNIIGCNFATDKDSELVKIITENGFKLREVMTSETYEEYQKMAQASVNIAYLPEAVGALEDMKERLGQTQLYLPVSYNYDEIIGGYEKLCDTLKIKCPDFSDYVKKADETVKKLKEKIGDIKIAVDFTATPRPLGLCRFLLKNGLNVTGLYTDNFNGEEKADFDIICEQYPSFKIYPTEQPSMRFAASSFDGEKYLAIGQKAAYFCATDNFVNIVGTNGLYGFTGIIKLCEMICDAFKNPKDRREVISYKGLGCESCL